MKPNIQRLIRQSMLAALLGGGLCAPSLVAAPDCVPGTIVHGTIVHGKCTPPPPPPGTPNFPKRPASDPIIKPHVDPPAKPKQEPKKQDPPAKTK